MTPMDASYNYNDFAGLHNITKRSEENEAEALKEVARQFESMFVKMMLKSMRDANAEFEKDSLFNSYESQFYRQMFDDQLALSMSQGKGIGLADSIYRQLSQQFGIQDDSASKPDEWLPIRESFTRQAVPPTQNPFSANTTLNADAQPNTAMQNSLDTDTQAITLDLTSNQTADSNVAVAALFSQKQKGTAQGAHKPLLSASELSFGHHPSAVTAEEKQALMANQSPVTSERVKSQLEDNKPRILRQSKPNMKLVPTQQSSESASTSGNVKKTSAFETPQEFIETLWPIAQKIGRKMGVEPKAIVAQAALETGWGKYIIHGANGQNSFNLFGIKADHRWDGEQVRVSTLEYRNGIAKREVAPFRSYDSYEASIRDYSQFILKSDRYQQAVEKGESIKHYSEGLQQGGYATDPHYAKKIQRIAGSELLNDAIAALELEPSRG